MRVIGLLLVLLTTNYAVADAQQRFLRDVPMQSATIYWVLIGESSALSQHVEATLRQLINDRFLPALNLQSLDAADWPDTVENRTKTYCAKSYVLLLLGEGESISDYRHLLDKLASQGVAITVLSAYSDAAWNKRALYLGSEQPWLLLDESPQLKQRLYRWLEQLYYGRAKQAMPVNLQSLSVAGGKAILSYSKATTTERWWSDILLFDSDAEQVLDTQGNNVLALDGSLEQVIDQYPSLSDQLRLPSQSPLWVDENASLTAATALQNAQWLDYFQISERLRQQLQNYWLNDNLQLLLMHLSASIGGQDINQQVLPYPLAGIQHSKPIVIDYGAQKTLSEQWADNYSAILLATLDGSLHSIDATQADNAAKSHALQHRFMVKPANTLKEQAARLWNTGQSEHSVSMDAPLSAVVEDKWKLAGNRLGHIDANDKVWLYIGQGRGGKGLYRYNISDPFQPQAAGHISKATDAAFSELGLSFAKPVGFVSQWQEKPQASLLLSAGYDVAYDTPERHARDIVATEGNALYLIDAANRGLLWKAGYGEQERAENHRYTHPAMRYAIASAPAVLSTSYPYRNHSAYVGDVAGQLWHIHLPACVGQQCQDTYYRQKHWSITRLAVLSDKTAEHDRRFFYAPAVWQQQGRHFIAIASGNREQPLERQVKNYLFVLPQPSKQLLKSTDIPLLASCIETGCSQSHAWKLALAAGELPLSSPVYHKGYVYLSTYQSQQAGCRWLEDRYRLYRVAISASGKPKKFDTLELVADSVYRLVDDNNIALLAPKIEDYLQALDADKKNADDEPIKAGDRLESQGIVIHSWREKNN